MSFPHVLRRSKAHGEHLPRYKSQQQCLLEQGNLPIRSHISSKPLKLQSSLLNPWHMSISPRRRLSLPFDSESLWVSILPLKLDSLWVCIISEAICSSWYGSSMLHPAKFHGTTLVSSWLLQQFLVGPFGSTNSSWWFEEWSSALEGFVWSSLEPSARYNQSPYEILCISQKYPSSSSSLVHGCIQSCIQLLIWIVCSMSQSRDHLIC